MDSMEQYFLDQMREYRICLSIGLKGSGKTYNSLKYIKYMLENEPKVYDKYLLILPAFQYEQNDSYAWLKEYKKQVNIYPYYSSVIFEQMIEKQSSLANKKKDLVKYFFLFDDCTCAGSTLFNIDDFLINAIATCRHVQCGMWYNAHGATKVLPPILRNNADFIFIYTISNSKLLEILFDEFISLTSDEKEPFKQFRNQYREHMQTEFNSFIISVRNCQIDWGTKTWKLFS